MTWCSGYIVASQEARSFDTSEFELRSADSPRAPSIRYLNQAFGLEQWHEFVLHSPVRLADEPEERTQGYDYSVFIVFGFARLIVLSQNKPIVDYLFVQILDRNIFPNLRKMSVFIGPLVEHCRKPESPYLVTSLHGQFAGAATDLKRISLYGDDVTRSSLYEQHHKLFNFQSAGLGRRPPTAVSRPRFDDRQIVRVGNDGSLNLNLSSRRRARELMDVVNFISAHRWVEEWVPLVRGKNAWRT